MAIEKRRQERRFVDNLCRHYNNPTPSERNLLEILQELAEKDDCWSFHFQHPLDYTWIIDFYIPVVRLAIEVDGSIHNTPSVRAKDRIKEIGLERLNITLMRFTNSEVQFKNKQAILEKLHEGWRTAEANLRNERRGLGSTVECDDDKR